MKYLVTGLTSSCTKITARMIALNLGLIDSIDSWDGREDIGNGHFLVSHRSLPHGHRSLNDRWISAGFALDYDYVIIVTRDVNCSIISSIKDHQPNKKLAKKEREHGMTVLRSIADNHHNVHFFSCETAYILQDSYTKYFLESIDIPVPVHVRYLNINEKYVGGSK